MRFKNSTLSDMLTLFSDAPDSPSTVVRNGDCYTIKNDHFLVECVFKKHKTGIISRQDTITNISGKRLTINTARSKFTLNGGEYEVYTQYSEHISEGMGAWHTLSSGVFGASDEVRTNQDVCPFVAIYNNQSSRGTAFHIMAKSAFEYRVSRHCEFLSPRVVTVELGFRGDDFIYALNDGESLILPEILYYDFENKLDLDAYKLHRYFNEKFKKPLPIIYNSWMSHFDDMSYDSLMLQLERAKAIGCEYFTVDAGWFGETQKWWDVVGDWSEPSECGMCGRLKDFADRVHECGLGFGLWFEIERASFESSNFKAHSELYTVCGNHAYIDFANPAAVDFIYSVLKENIDKYGIDFIKFDLNAPLTYSRGGCAFIKYYEGWCDFLGRIKRDFPLLHLECCASGGGRMSLSNVPYFDSFWMSDNHGIYEQLDIFKSTLIRMPSSILEHWATIRSLEGFTPTYPVGGTTEKILLSADCSWIHLEEANMEYIKNALVGGPVGVSCDLTQVSDKTLSELGDFISEYKADREFWRNSECRILCSTDSLTILQFNDPDFNDVRIFAYTDKYHQEETTVYPVLDTDACYSVTKAEREGVMSLEETVLSAKEIRSEGIDLCTWGLRCSYKMNLKRQ
ncbi:MAG: alpha-galactosidase [Clostridia bacterium]|nr:alpha-galactosidase [Clostridia bacterium]